MKTANIAHKQWRVTQRSTGFFIFQSRNSSDELAFILMQNQSNLTVKLDDFLFLKTINNHHQPCQVIKNGRLHFCGFGYKSLTSKKSCVWSPVTISRNMGLLRAFEVVVIYWEVHLRNSGTRTTCVQRCVVATWLLAAWLMWDERVVINPPHLIAHKCKRTSVPAASFQKTGKRKELLWESEKDAMRHLCVSNAHNNCTLLTLKLLKYLYVCLAFSICLIISSGIRMPLWITSVKEKW